MATLAIITTERAALRERRWARRVKGAGNRLVIIILRIPKKRCEIDANILCSQCIEKSYTLKTEKMQAVSLRDRP